MNATVLELQKGKVGVTSGVTTGNQVVHCEVDGSITITWDDDTTTLYNMSTGSDRNIRDNQMKTVEVTTGTFTIMNY